MEANINGLQKNTKPYFVAGLLLLIQAVFQIIYFSCADYTAEITGLTKYLYTYFISIFPVGIYIFLSLYLWKTKTISTTFKWIFTALFTIYITLQIIFCIQSFISFFYSPEPRITDIVITFLGYLFDTLPAILITLILFNRNTTTAIIVFELISITACTFAIIYCLYLNNGFDSSIKSVIRLYIFYLIQNIALIVLSYGYKNNEFPIKIKYNPAGIPCALLKTNGVAKCIILSILTGGIYFLYWQFSLCKKIKLLNDEKQSGIGEFICLVFVPFYLLFWVFTRSKTIFRAASRKGITVSDNSIINIILPLIGLYTISLSIMQFELNEIALKLNSIDYNAMVFADKSEYPEQQQPDPTPVPPPPNAETTGTTT